MTIKPLKQPQHVTHLALNLVQGVQLVAILTGMVLFWVFMILQSSYVLECVLLAMLSHWVYFALATLILSIRVK